MKRFNDDIEFPSIPLIEDTELYLHIKPLVSLGLSAQEIAQRLGIHRSTAKHYIGIIQYLPEKVSV